MDVTKGFEEPKCHIHALKLKFDYLKKLTTGQADAL